MEDTPDKKGFFVIVRADTDKTIKIEEDAFRAIKSFEKGHTVVEVSGIIGRSKKDVIALVRNLTEAGFIKSIDENNIKDTYPTIRPFKFFLSQNIRYTFNSHLGVSARASVYKYY